MAAEHQSGLTPLAEYRWPTDAWFVALINVELKEIAARNGLAVRSWEEDGLGMLTGCGGRLPSGIVVDLVESPYLVSSGKTSGPALNADVTDVGRVGIEAVLQEALIALGLTEADVQERGIAPTAEEVEGFTRTVAEIRARHAMTGADPQR